MSSEQPAKVKRLARQLCGFRRATRQTALRTVATLYADQRLALLERLLRHAYGRGTAVQWGCPLVELGLTLGVYLSTTQGTVLPLGVGMLPALTLCGVARAKCDEESLLAILHDVPDTRLLPVVLSWTQPRGNALCDIQLRLQRALLKLLLPLLKAGEAQAWTPEQCDSLAVYLRFPMEDVELTLEIL